MKRDDGGGCKRREIGEGVMGCCEVFADGWTQYRKKSDGYRKGESLGLRERIHRGRKIPGKGLCRDDSLDSGHKVDRHLRVHFDFTVVGKRRKTG